MNTDIAGKILRAASYSMSATALAQKVGKSKAVQISEELDYLVDNGSLIKDESGTYPMYKAAPKSAVVKTQATTNAVVADSVSTTKGTIPTGYTVSKLGKRKSDGLVGRKVTLPNGRSYFVEKGDTLVSINDGDDVKVITSKNGAMPEAQISTLIEQYTSSHNMTAYTIKSKCGSIGRDGAVGVLDYKITKCNKAA